MLPQINRIRKSITNIVDFRGLNRTCNIGFSRISANNTSAFTEFKDMKNLSSDKYPQLSPRPCRSRVYNIENTKIISNILSVNSGLIFIDMNGYLHYETKTKLVIDIDKEVMHELVLFGNNVVIFPDNKYFNLSDEEFYEINVEKNKKCSSGLILEDKYEWAYNCSIHKCDLTTSGKPRKNVAVCKTHIDFLDCDIQKKQNNSYFKYEDLFRKISIGDTVEDASTSPSTLYRCISKEEISDDYIDGVKKKFIVIDNYYLQINANGIGTTLKKGDYIKIFNLTNSLLNTDEWSDEYIDVLNNNYFEVFYVRSNFIVIKAIVESSVPYDFEAAGGEISVSRIKPESDIDKTIEVNNRLWTCNSKTNEIYASKLGDCTNWQAYSKGISTDSFAMTVGCEGEFTGIARQNDSVLFFKENWVLKIYGTKPSNYTLATYNVLGVAKGSSKSIVWINGVLYYLSNKGVCQYAPGSQPVVISERAFGDIYYKNGVAGRHRNKYYISAQNEYGDYELFVFDTETGIWHKEDNTQMLSATTYNNTMYYVDGKTGCIMCPDNKCNLIETNSNYQQEGEFEWSCETGDLYDSDFNAKYISRMNIGLRSDKGTRIKILAQFSDGGEWFELRTLRYDYKKPHTIPVVVRRSEYLRLKIVGTGQCEIYGIDIEYARGSDKK